MFGNFLTGRYAARVGIQMMTLAGALITAVGMALSLFVFLIGYGSVASFFGFMVTVGLGNGLVLPNATTGIMSVRPHLAGTASGIGGAIMIAGGATMSALSGAMLNPESGARVLVTMMLCSSACSVMSISYVILRERTLDDP